MSEQVPVRVILYGKPDCHLCHEAEAVLRRLQDELGLQIENVSIEGRPELEAEYGTEIPVVFVEGAKLFKYRIDERRLRRSVEALRSRL